MTAWPSAQFPPTYALARGRFLAKSEALGADLSAYLHPLRGAEGEELALDVAVWRPSGARRALVIASATHGVEGFAGSGIQQHLLDQRAAWLGKSPVALVLVHAHNPYGFSFVRRTDERNVDLNRNGIDFAQPPPSAPAYDEVHELLVPADWEGPSHRAAQLALQALAKARGERALAAAICGGQWSHSDGLFYGGREPGFTCRAIQRLCQQELAGFEQVVLLDLHTGLGPRGHGELIYAGSSAAPDFARLQAWLGGELTSSERGDSVSTPVQGTIDQVYRRALAQRQEAPTRGFGAVVLEFGTEPLAQVLQALIADNWLHLRGQLDSELGRAIKAKLKAALFGSDGDWQQAVLTRSLEVSRRLVQGLQAGA